MAKKKTMEKMPGKSEQELRDDLARDCVALLHSKTFYGHVLVAIEKTFDPRLRAAAGVQASTHVLLRINPEKYFAEEPQHRQGILEHEILHVILKHILRGMDFPNQAKANVAADIAVNPLIGRDNLPPWTIWPDHFELPENQTFEWYYDNIPEPEGKGKGGSDCQSGGQGGEGDSDGEDQNPYCPPGTRTVDDHNWQSAIPEDGRTLAEITIDRLIKTAEKQCGDLPGNIAELIQFRAKHVVPWQAILRRFFGTTRANLSWTKKRRSKRYDTVPGTRFEEKATVVIGVDSSGSISDAELSAFMTECYAAFRTGIVDVWVVVCDADITDVFYPFRKVSEVSGRGGTDFRPVFQWALDNTHHPPIDGIVYLTDGYGPAPEKRSKIPTLWVVTQDGQFPAEWGQRLQLPDIGN